MEKKNKIIIVALIIVIIALIVGLAFMLGDKVNGSSGDVKEGMVAYNFDSVFTMQVPEDTIFNKTWNSSEDIGLHVNSNSYIDLNKKFAVRYADSPMLTNDYIELFAAQLNTSGNASVNHDGDLIILEKTSKKSDFGDLDVVKFSKSVAVTDGTTTVILYGNDLEELKEMANTIKFRGD